MKSRIIAFIFGDIFATVHVLLAGILYNFAEFGLKVIATLFIGLAGGLAGMLAKDFYPYLKKYVTKKRKIK